MKYTAIIVRAQKLSWGTIDAPPCVTGLVYGDKKKRWDDGTEIKTSPIVSINQGGNLVRTKNSVYFVDWRT